MRQSCCVTTNKTVLLIEKALGEPLVDYLQRHREDDRSWQWIANDLARLTGAQYSREMVRRWYVDSDQNASAA